MCDANVVYGSETWGMRSNWHTNVNCMVMRCRRNVCRVTSVERITN